MKSSPGLLALTAALCVGSLTLNAADKQHPAGPKGGRLLEKTEPQAEFLLEKDHTATITFYDAVLKPVPASSQIVTVIADVKGDRKTVEFEKRGDVLVSRTKMPEGDGYNLIVQFRKGNDAKPQNYRFKLDTHECSDCKRAEYACICDH